MILNFDKQPLVDAVDDGPSDILDGRAVAEALRGCLRPIVDQLRERGVQPSLSVVQVGDHEASSIYIRHKMKACEQLGIEARHHHLKSDTSYRDLLALLHRLNNDSSVHGVLLQLPLPDGMDGSEAMQLIDPRKDVDGFHPVNLGSLMSRRSLLEPCTPTGIMTLLEAAGIDPAGQRAVVIGRSLIVGRPMALMLVRANATMTLCHRHTENLADIVSSADILVVATGVAELCQGEWLKEGAVVIDVGISRVDGSLCGDVQFEAAKKRASRITPVPGGVGPMTVATLLENTVRAACIQEDLVVRDGTVVDCRDVGLRYETIDNLGITQLRADTDRGVSPGQFELES